MDKGLNDPAFPMATTVDTTDFHGMTLHEYYAGQALPTCLTMDYNHGLTRVGQQSELHVEKAVAKAWQIADEMMKQRSARTA